MIKIRGVKRGEGSRAAPPLSFRVVDAPDSNILQFELLWRFSITSTSFKEFRMVLSLYELKLIKKTTSLMKTRRI